MRRRVFFISVFLAFTYLLSAGISSLPQKRSGKLPQLGPLNPDFLNPPKSEYGLIPHKMDLSHLETGEEAWAMDTLPSAWDWRDYGGVTPAKNQLSCPVCWAFAATGILEAKVLIESGTAYDFSEENMKECNFQDRGCFGGTIKKATSYFTTQGTVLEECDPYNPGTTGVCNSSCVKIKQVTGWRLLGTKAEATVKNAIYQYGPVYATMYSSFPGFVDYDGSYVAYYTGSEGPNHAVMIVGWDDNLSHAGGTGAWICKNSWGADWGENGFFYIAYGSANIGGMGNYIESYKDYDYSESLYHYDEGGWRESYGFGSDDTAWGLVKFTASDNGSLHAVDFWAVARRVDYTIYVYDDFDGSELSNLLYDQSGYFETGAGYYSIPLDTAVPVMQGDDFFVVIRLNTIGYNYPVPTDTYDTYVPIETGKCYMSPDGSAGSWTDLGVANDRDIGIRARVLRIPAEPVCTIKANGSNGSLTITKNDNLIITISLDSADYAGDSCDWWLVCETPFSPPHNRYHYNIATKSWIPGFLVSYQSNLRDVGSREVLNQSGFIPGLYTFYFGIDMVMNGSIDRLSGFFDKVKVTVTN